MKDFFSAGGVVLAALLFILFFALLFDVGKGEKRGRASTVAEIQSCVANRNTFAKSSADSVRSYRVCVMMAGAHK